MRQPIIGLAGRRREGQHPGLILQRYIAKAIVGDNGDSEERKALLDAVIYAGRSASLRAIYADAYKRWSESFADVCFNGAMELGARGRLIVGFGTENVLEAGIRLHHTYGVPLIPGSALKGLASHYCDEVWGQKHVEPVDEQNVLFRHGDRYHHLLFGDMEDGGVITFHDAWITPSSLNETALRLDVMTPHHPEWQTSKKPPTDFDSPTPVSFLSVAGTFQVRLSWSGPAETTKEQAQAWIALALNLLQEALANWGVGGKTSSGYGRLVAPNLAQSSRPVLAEDTTATPELPKVGAYVEAVLLEEKTKNNGWKARDDLSGMTGPIQNYSEVPADKKAGDKVSLIIAIAKQPGGAFKYPTPEVELRAQKPSGKPQNSKPHKSKKG